VNMPFDRRLASRRTFLQSVCLGSAATGLRIGQANAQDTPAATQNSLPPVPGKQLPVGSRAWTIAPCPIINYGMEPVFYYQPKADPQRWYEVHLYNYQINGMGAIETVPLVNIVATPGMNKIIATPLPDFQSFIYGVQKVGAGNTDAPTRVYYRMARFSANNKEYAHRLFVGPSNTPYPIIDNLSSTATDNLIRDVSYQDPPGTLLVDRSFSQFAYNDSSGALRYYRLQQPF